MITVDGSGEPWEDGGGKESMQGAIFSSCQRVGDILIAVDGSGEL